MNITFKTALLVGMGLTLGYEITEGMLQIINNNCKRYLKNVRNRASAGDQNAIKACEFIGLKYSKNTASNIIKMGFQA